MSSESASEMVWKTVRSSWNPSGRLASTRRSRLILARAFTLADRSIRPFLWNPAKRSLMQHRADVVARQLFPALEKIELDDESQSRHFSAKLFNQLRHRAGRAAGGENIVDD